MSVLHIIFLLFIISKFNNAAKTCRETINSVVNVTHCPANRNEWLKAEKQKDCESLSHNCESSEKLKYHCAPTEDINKLVELCANPVRLFDFCPEWNTGGKVLQPAYNRSCVNFSEPCSEPYLSNEAFHYQDCYPNKSTASTIEYKKRDSSNSRIIIIGSVLSAVAFGICIFILIIRYHRKQKRKQEYITASLEIENLS